MVVRTYRSLVRLYPREFRRAYGDDLVQHFADLVAARGVRTAWARTSVDLIVTVPRYRLESIMTEPHATTTLSAGIALATIAGVLSVLSGLYVGAVLLLVAAGLTVARRGTLARAIRTPVGNRRRNRLAIGSGLALIAGAAIVSYGQAISDNEISGTSLFVHNVIGVPAMIGSVIFLIAGLLTPRAGRDPLDSASAA